MNPQIQDFINEQFTPDFVLLIQQTLSLFEAFDHQNAYQGMLDAINNESVSDVPSRIDHFTVKLVQELDYILDQHLIKLSDESSIRDRYNVLEALFRFQHLESYIPYRSILDTEYDPNETMSNILAELTSMDEGYFLSILKEVDPRTLNLMSRFIELKETIEEPLVSKPIVDRLKLMVKALGPDTIGQVLIEGGMLIGLSIDLYLPFVKDDLIVSDREASAKNILSIILMSDTEQSDVIQVYRRIAETFIDKLDEVSRLESIIVTLLSQFDETRRIHDEQIRLLKESVAG